MTDFVFYGILFVLILGVMAGIALMSRVEKAALGNLISAGCTAIAMLLALYRYDALTVVTVWIALGLGFIVGIIGAYRVKMIQMPQTVAMLNGFGGTASAFVAIVVLFEGTYSGFETITAGFALCVGFLTLTGSLIAAGKLHNVLPGKPIVWKQHQLVTVLSIILMVLTIIIMPIVGITTHALVFILILLILSGFFGVAFTVRVGGADMPIAISLLNSLSGIAVSAAGMTVSDPLLVSVGAIIGAAGLVLTQIMCQAMNRSLLSILLSKAPDSKGKAVESKAVAAKDEAVEDKAATAEVDSQETESEGNELAAMKSQREESSQEPPIDSKDSGDSSGSKDSKDSGDSRDSKDSKDSEVYKGSKNFENLEASELSPQHILAAAKQVIIVPGYGMALAGAQFLVKQLMDKLEANGVEVKFAIHPVAGRMPGHMNVLLAEVDVPYDKLYEIDDINPQFVDCDAVIVVGANDVINPAAHTAVDTPIYGLPILDVEKAKHVIVCNYDLKPGYAGVANPLYEAEHTLLMLGDAKESLGKLLLAEEVNLALDVKADEFTATIKTAETASTVEKAGIIGIAENINGDSSEENLKDNPQQLLASAKRVIIVPGYGMALAGAQLLVKQLMDKLEANGVEVKFAIHPVAGRMPGHMNVLLAEVDVPYDKLYEIDDINPQFVDCDAVIVVGANDVVNPAAHTAVDTPIYGLPILDVEKAKHVIICNYDLKPGYAGVANPLYEAEHTVLMLGDAKESLAKLL